MVYFEKIKIAKNVEISWTVLVFIVSLQYITINYRRFN